MYTNGTDSISKVGNLKAEELQTTLHVYECYPIKSLVPILFSALVSKSDDLIIIEGFYNMNHNVDRSNNIAHMINSIQIREGVWQHWQTFLARHTGSTALVLLNAQGWCTLANPSKLAYPSE